MFLDNRYIGKRISLFYFFNDTATTKIYTYLHTLSLPDSLPISSTFVSVHHVRQVLISETRKTGTVRNRPHVCSHVHVVGGMSRRRIMGHLDAPMMGGGWRPR